MSETNHRLRRPLFGDTPALLAYCVLVGALGGVAALVFDFLVDFVEHWLLGAVGGYTPPEAGTLEPHLLDTVRNLYWLPIATTLGGLLSGFLVYRFAPETEGHGTDAAIGAYHTRGGEVRARTPILKAITAALTIGSGGVAGKEGPTAQITVGLTGLVTRWLRLRGQSKRHLMLAGMAAGLSAVFRAPLGMAIFSVEILYSGMAFEAEALIYTVIAAVSAYAVFGLFSGFAPLFVIPEAVHFSDPKTLIGFAMLGVLAGVLGSVLPTLLYECKKLFSRVPGPPHIRPAIGGLLVGLVAMAVPEVLGTGYGFVQLAMVEQLPLATALLLLLAKGPTMCLTIGSGGSGGVFAPTVTLGAMLGAIVGTGLEGLGLSQDMPLASFVVVGMAAVFAGAARTPISTLIMVAEMTGGYGLIVPAMLANVLSFLVQQALAGRSRYPTLYEAQVETHADSPLHRGVFVRRALEFLEAGHVEAADIRLPRLVNLLRYGEPISVSQDGGFLAALVVEPDSKLDGQSVAQQVGTVEGATAIAVLRSHDMLIPRGDTVLESGDQLLLVATAAALGEMRQRAETQTGSA